MSDYYENLDASSDAELMAIINHPDDNDSSSVAIARRIAAKRGLGGTKPDSLQPVSASTQQIINIVCIVSLLELLYIYYNTGVYFWQMATKMTSVVWGVNFVFNLLAIILFPAGVYFFWKGKKVGWSILAAYFTYTLAGELSGFINIPIAVLKQFNWPVIILFFIVNTALWWLLLRKDIKQVYGIQSYLSIRVTSIAAGLAIAVNIGMWLWKFVDYFKIR